MANVTVFNLYNEPVSGLSVSGYAAGKIAGYADGSQEGLPRYTPACLLVPRTKSPESEATFAIGDNPVVVPWNSFRGSGTVTIPDPAKDKLSLDDDLILLLAVNQAVLMEARGFVRGIFELTLRTASGDLVEPPA